MYRSAVDPRNAVARARTGVAAAADDRLSRVRSALAGIILGVVVLLPAWPSAQETAAEKGAPAAPHRFFDLPNIALTGMESGALLADGIYTQRGLREYPGMFREVDPIARPFVMRGWPGQIAGGALFVGADVGLRYWLHRKRHHRLERLLPLALTVYGAVGAIHDARELR